jgi:hypothetical protein
MRTLLSLLLLVPGTLLAQSPPAKAPHSLRAALITSASVKPGDGNSTVKPEHAISTGAVPPELIHTARLECEAKAPRLTARTMVVVVSLIVDPSGIPTHLHVDQPVDAVTDQEVLDTISKFRYKPGTLDGIETDYPVVVNYKIARGAVY